MAWENYFQWVQESAQFIQKKTSIRPQLAVVLSGGLDPFVESIQEKTVLHSSDIPHFPKARAEGHAGQIIFGTLGGVPLVALKGRYHYYEGLSPQEVVFPYFVLRELGMEFVMTTNAVGGIRKDLDAGDLMLVTDHINFMGTNPLIGLSVQRKTNQFPSMQQAYDPALRELSKVVAKKMNLPLKEGVYVGVPGPSYETPSEILAFRSLGADSVGMSTIFEVIAARFLGVRVVTLNIITNPSSDRHAGTMNHQEVLEAMNRVQPFVVTWLKGMVAEIGKLS